MLALLVGGVGGLVSVSSSGTHHVARVASGPASTIESTTSTSSSVPPSTTTVTVAPTSTTAATTTTTAAPAVVTHAALAGCPVPPHPPLPPPPPPWHPAVEVPSASLPPVTGPVAWSSDLGPITGKGMWIWQWSATDAGNPAAIVRDATRAGLHQVWIRVADSMNGFYGASELDALVPAAHAAGLRVMAWGFPYLYDPVGDAAWSAQVLAWRTPTGQQIDGFSADIEEPTEGVDLTAQRTGVYLQAVRKAAGSRLLVATVYPPLDSYWAAGHYPYATMARYVDAFAAMIYWECTDPGADAAGDVARLSTLKPVHIIGQAYDMAAEGGRPLPPSAAEITEFMSSGRQAGALGASFWVWQSARPEEWAAISGYPWAGR